MRNNKIIIFSAPSGSGKSTIVQEFLKDKTFELSVSATTRSKREYEIDGKHYNFISLEEFKSKIDSESFIEYEEVYDNQFYGTLKENIENLWSKNKTILFDVDVKGAVKLKKYFGEQALSVFIKVPSIDILTKRLYSRGTESDLSIQRRAHKFEEELKYIEYADYILVNDILENTMDEIKKVVSEWTLR